MKTVEYKPVLNLSKRQVFTLIEPHKHQRTVEADMEVVINNLRNEGWNVTVYMPEIANDVPIVWAKIPERGSLKIATLSSL